jgi:hypothetical protein
MHTIIVMVTSKASNKSQYLHAWFIIALMDKGDKALTNYSYHSPSLIAWNFSL